MDSRPASGIKAKFVPGQELMLRCIRPDQLWLPIPQERAAKWPICIHLRAFQLPSHHRRSSIFL